MAIPAISIYKMPTESDLPMNKVTWKLDPKRAALLIHDMQEYFLDAYCDEESPKVELISNIQRIRQTCKGLHVPVIYTAQPGGQTLEQRGLLQDFWGAGIPEGPYKQKIVDELAPDDHDIFLTKWRYSAFKKTNLLEILHEQGRDQLIICGVYAHIGCLLTACEAFMDGIQPFFIADAVADFSFDHHRQAMQYASDRCAVTTTTNAVLTDFQRLKEESESAITLQMIREQVAQLLRESPADIANDENLLNRGLDSVRLMSLVEKWRQIGVEVTFADLAEHPTISDWFRMIASQKERVL
ncbi:isochorismatase family protein [Bacillus cytotoxicus]|uniref:isochorismatase n=1 Tax=Bacillus cytotoxicus (strain DSM 22905 / CIP 110041 / 391-98 / NVH 391-98) TaxID=315749 RepID=A7GPJ9_BACCN|nr:MULTISPECIES: isochorismatase family protein [Bacillus cereus group]ABS22057.1 Isochorismatase [Bacillus cytotoxicus NVH 391-98]AWC28664.1 isochorismatase [Bacillus cytotoxicus]AWC32678.1 isochorismatase [Bacillus cytotoxicus]AWC36707.1 isochorismatase [Bacillus cytotoxicus]AWC39953.1 isochorismatase [Bacillus cytotoxicus]